MFVHRRGSYPIRISRQLYNRKLLRRAQNNKDYIVIQTRSGLYRRQMKIITIGRSRKEMIMIIPKRRIIITNNKKM